MKRKGISVEEARQAIPDSVSKRSDLPFVMMKSGSSGHGFYLFIEHLAPQETSVAGEFSRYGLSTTATVPWF
jgi:CRISPR-associated endonuclease Csy4